MEIILREDVDKLGQRGQVVKVAEGYARNFLLPRRMAVPATGANKKIVEQERQAYLKREAKVEGEAKELAALMGTVEVTIAQKAGENEQLFGSVTANDIVVALEKAGYGRSQKGPAGRADQDAGRFQGGRTAAPRSVCRNSGARSEGSVICRPILPLALCSHPPRADGSALTSA